jgi:hypothetical protein
MDHVGHLQAGGVESGQPWVVAVANVTDETVSFRVNNQVVASLDRTEVTLTAEDEIYRVESPKETLFFKPNDLNRFQVDLKSEKSAADQIALATVPSAVGAKSKVAAGVLGIILGGIGAHKFYLGNIGMGILYLVFSWTFIPSLVGFIEGILYLTMSDAEFARKYG